MDPERYSALREHYHAIAPLDGERRQAALGALRAERPSLALELAEWLEDGEGTDPLAAALRDPVTLRERLLADVGQAAFEELPMERVGPFRLLRRIGRGSMGHVYEALQSAPERRVALKVLHAPSASTRTLQRFDDEIEILGRIEHENVARIYASGSVATPAGELRYFAMEWIEGPTLGDWMRDAGPPLRERLRVFRGICAGLVEAHARGVVHRDLKPANVLIGSDGAPKILDFGVSRLLGAEREGEGSRTRAGELLGTLQYMSPEQLAGDPAAVDTRSDVYSAGVVLFELITGELPRDSSSADLLPALEELQRSRVRRLVDVQPDLDADLSVLCAKALELSPAERYGSIQELDADLAHYLNSEPILARPPGMLRRARLFARRHRRAALGLGLALGLVLFSAALIVRYAQRAEAGAQRARAAELRAGRNAYRAGIAGAYAALGGGDTAGARALLEATAPGLRGWEAGWLAGRLDPSEHVLQGHLNQVWDAAFTPDGARLITVGGALVDRPGEQALRCWDTASGALLYTRLMERAELLEVAMHPSGEFVATAGPIEDPNVRLFRAADGEPLGVLSGHAERIAGLEFSGDGERLYSVGRDGELFVWRASRPGAFELERRTTLGPTKIEAACIEGGRLFCVSSSGPGVVLELDTFEELAELPGAAISVAAHGARVALGSGTSGGAIQVFELTDADPPSLEFLTVFAQRESVRSLLWLHDGRALCAGGMSGMLRAWDVDSGRRIAAHAGHERELHALAADPGQRWLATTSRDTDARLWRLAEAVPDPAETIEYGYLRSISASADGSRVAVADMRAALRLFDGEPQELASWPPAVPLLHAVALSPDGARVAHESENRLLLRSGDALTELGEHASRIHSVRWNWAADRIVSGSDAGEVGVWDGATGRLLHRFATRANRLWVAEFDPSGERLAVCGDHGVVDVHALDGALLHSLEGHADVMVSDVAWSPSGRLVASCDAQGRVLVFESETGRRASAFEPFSGRAMALTFGADDSRLFAGSYDGALHVLDPLLGVELLAVREFATAPTALDFSARTGDLWVATETALQVLRGAR